MPDPQPRLAHMLLGIEGIALLRHWPQDPARLAALTEEIARLSTLAEKGVPPTDPFLEPTPSREVSVPDGYGSWAFDYDAGIPSNPVILAEEAPVRSALGRIPPGRVLDAACGTGRWTSTLAAAGHEAHGVDLTPAMLARAREAAPGAHLACADVAGLPFGSGTYDAVVCALALTHVKELSPTLREFRRVLRPAGRLVISDVHPFFTALGLHAFSRRPDGESVYVRNVVHHLSEYVRVLIGAGFSVEGVDEGPWTPEIIATQRWATLIPDTARDALEGLPLVIVLEATPRG